MRVYLVTLISIIVITLVGFLLLGRDGIFASEDDSDFGYVTVVSEPDNQLVSINGSFIGKTPIRVLPVEPGKLNVKIGEYWEEAVAVAEGKESVIYRDVRTAEYGGIYGYTIEHSNIGRYLFKENELLIDVVPRYAETLMDGNVVRSVPSVAKGLSVGEHDLSVNHHLFHKQDLKVFMHEDTNTRVSVSLRPDQLTSIRRQEIDLSNYESIPVGTEEIATRVTTNFSGQVIADSVNFVTSPWKSISIWEAEVADGIEPTTMLSELDSLFSFELISEGIESGQRVINALPFAYIVMPDGKIYEGLGVFDFDYGGISNVKSKINQVTSSITYETSVVPILVLVSARNNNESLALSSTSVSSIKQIQKQLESGPPLSAELVTKTSTLDLSFGENRVIDFEWQNNSSGVWKKGEVNIWLVTKDGVESRVYDPITWKSSTRVVTFNEDLVLPGELVTFTLPIQGGYFPGSFTEVFELKNVDSGKVVEGAELELQFALSGETANTLSIGASPNGFLSVRSSPNQQASLISAVFTNEKFAWTQQRSGWVEIIMRDGGKGWVQTTYVNFSP